MLFKYIGPEQSMNGVYGHDFSGHKIVEVTTPLAVNKLSGNPYFEEVLPEIPQPKKLKVKEAK